MRVSNVIPEYEIVAPNEALVAWKHDPITTQVLGIILQELQTSSERMGNGETLGENIIQNTARAVGYVEGLQFAETLFKLGDVVETKEDDDDGDAEEDSSAVR